MLKKNAPNDHSFIQRTYPDLVFDHTAYVSGLKQASADQQLLTKSQCTTTFPGSWTLEGPGNIGGRINCVAVHPSDKNIMYAGNACGGIFKTTNGGITWNPVFDDKSYLAIGTIVFEPGNPNTLYAGTGDPNIGSYMFVGDGIYKSTDAGATWTNIGLNSQGIISKIIVDPGDPQVIYAATMGLPFIRNNNRGLYKTTDGGQNWTQVLFISNDAGIIDMVMDNSNPQILYAAGWNRIRNYQESIAIGQAAKIYKTTDGGATWTTLTGNLPQSDMSRIGLTISATNPNLIYALYIDTDYNLHGIYKTSNGGANWTLVAANNLNPQVMGGFGWYFGKIRISPYNDNELFVLGVGLHKSTDGGTTWFEATPPWWQYEVHADKHDLVITAPGEYVLATDGGLYKTGNGGITWNDIENIPNTQFYRVAVNPHEPGVYWGGAQDNGTTKGNSSGINNWPRILGGDGFQPLFHPTDPDIFFAETQNGDIWQTLDGGLSFNSATDGINSSDRRNWDMPVIMNAASELMYTGTYRIYRSGSINFPYWTPISPDLTKGVVFEPRFHTISTIAESQFSMDHIYAGTSDGNVWRSLNGGALWENISSTLPDRYVTSIKTSPHNPDVVYVSHSGYKSNEHIPHIHKSTDHGTTWTDISGDLPQLAVNSLLIHPGFEDHIFAATDGGVYGTSDGGLTWCRIGDNMPVIPVYDLTFDPVNHKLVAGTYARSLMTFQLDSLDSPTAVKSDSNRDLVRVYPNPVASTINLISNGDYKTAIIFNSGGIKIKEVSIKKDLNKIPADELRAGIYFISGHDEGRRFTARFLKM